MLPSSLELIEKSFELYSVRAKKMMPVLVIFFLIQTLSGISAVVFKMGSFLKNPRNLELNAPFLLAIALLTIVFLTQAYFAFTILRILRFSDKGGLIGHLKSTAAVYFKTLAATIIISIASGIGFLFFIVPGIFIFTILFFSQYYILFENSEIIESFKRSWNLVKGRIGAVMWRLLVPILILGFLNAIINRILGFIISDNLLPLLSVTEFARVFSSMLIFAATSSFFYPWIYGNAIILFEVLRRTPDK